MFFFKQETAYERRISDWSSDVRPSELNSNRLSRNSRKGMSRVAGECAIIDIRSLPPGWSIRWSHRPLKYIAHSMSSSRRCSNDSTMPVSGDAVVTSYKRVSLARSSQGKLKIVANVKIGKEAGREGG